MQRLQMKFPMRRFIVVAVLIFLAVNTVGILVAVSMSNLLHRNEIIDATDKFIGFQNELANLMETGSMLLTGYEAYLKINGVLTNEESEAFLGHLTADEMTYIRNIGIIKDTVIVYNFPSKGNEASLGIDLAKVEGQREVILRTKETMKGSFQGPVDLVQGGQGFILRIPLTDNEGLYWGQVSIVLKAEEIFKSIDNYAKESGIDVAIYEDATNEKLVFGDPTLRLSRPLVFDVDKSLNDWVVYVRPLDGWHTFDAGILAVLIIGFILSTIMAFSSFYIQKVTYSLQYSLAHDSLTGLYNRYYLEKVQVEVLKESLENDGKFGLMHLDLDYFKVINDKYGHGAGDEVLIDTAQILEKLTRSEELVFRIGGDEFLVMLPKVRDKDEITAFKKRLRNEFRDIFDFDKYTVDIGPSIGVALFPDDGHNFDEVLRNADVDMYNEKGQNKR